MAMPNLMKTINLQIQEVQQTQSTSNMKKTTSMCIVTKPSKSYDKCNIIKLPEICSKDQNKDARRIFPGNYPRKNIAVQHFSRNEKQKEKKKLFHELYAQ